MLTVHSYSSLFFVYTVIRKIFGSKIFSDAQCLPKFIYLKISRYEYLEHEYLRRENFARAFSLKRACVCFTHLGSRFVRCPMSIKKYFKPRDGLPDPRGSLSVVQALLHLVCCPREDWQHRTSATGRGASKLMRLTLFRLNDSVKFSLVLGKAIR